MTVQERIQTLAEQTRECPVQWVQENVDKGKGTGHATKESLKPSWHWSGCPDCKGTGRVPTAVAEVVRAGWCEYVVYDMLFCQHCDNPHIDQGDLQHDPHKTHLCHYCGKLFGPIKYQEQEVRSVGVSDRPIGSPDVFLVPLKYQDTPREAAAFAGRLAWAMRQHSNDFGYADVDDVMGNGMSGDLEGLLTYLESL